MTIVRVAGHKLPWRPIVFAFAQNGNNEWWGWNTRVCGHRCMSHAWRRTHSARDSSTGCGDHTQGRRYDDVFDNDIFGEDSKQASKLRFRRLEKVDLELLNGMVISWAPPNNHWGRHNECSDCTSRQAEKQADKKGRISSILIWPHPCEGQLSHENNCKRPWKVDWVLIQPHHLWWRQTKLSLNCLWSRIS